MLSDSDVQALVAAQHSNPFAVLGMHEDAEGRLWVRALLPGALSVTVCDAQSQREITELKQRHDDGLFEASIARRRKRFDYRLKITWHSGESGVYDDAYRHDSYLSKDKLEVFSQGQSARAYELLGAQPMKSPDAVEGVRFSVWAPNAMRVSVVGDFNAWDGRRNMMRLHHVFGVWDIFVPHVRVGDRYKFELLDSAGKLLPLKADPYARAAELRPATASIVADLPELRALDAKVRARNKRTNAISIYEVQLASWQRRADGSYCTWDEIAKTLPQYAAGLGFTHIELLPISEYPFDGSWGYQTLGLFAPTSRFGTPEGFARFVEACHAQNLGVLLDWVPAHFPMDAHGLAQFDGTALYEYADPREGFHRDWNTAIYNFSRNEVRSFLTSSALYWMERFGVDGLRVDAVASMLYRDYSRKDGQWVPNVYGGRENLEAISLFKHINGMQRALCEGTVTIAEESTTFPKVSGALEEGGLGFAFKWNMGWMNDTLRYMQEDPVHRQWHHDKLTFGLVYAFSEQFVLPLSHDEVVHGKGSLLAKMPGDEWQRFANLRAYYGFMWGHPGKKLLFMGQEFAQATEWNHDAALPWDLLKDAKHSGMQQLVRDLNKLYREQPALHQLDGAAKGFEWIVADDAAQSVLAWLRRSNDGQAVMVVSNFTPVSRQAYRLGVPDGMKQWKEMLNTDAARYGGSNVGNLGAALKVDAVAAHGRAQSLTLTLPPLSTVFLMAL